MLRKRQKKPLTKGNIELHQIMNKTFKSTKLVVELESLELVSRKG